MQVTMGHPEIVQLNHVKKRRRRQRKRGRKSETSPASKTTSDVPDDSSKNALASPAICSSGSTGDCGTTDTSIHRKRKRRKRTHAARSRAKNRLKAEISIVEKEVDSQRKSDDEMRLQDQSDAESLQKPPNISWDPPLTRSEINKTELKTLHLSFSSFLEKQTTAVKSPEELTPGNVFYFQQLVLKHGEPTVSHEKAKLFLRMMTPGKDVPTSLLYRLFRRFDASNHETWACEEDILSDEPFIVDFGDLNGIRKLTK